MASKCLAPKRALNSIAVAVAFVCLFVLALCLRPWHTDGRPATPANAQPKAELLRPAQPTLVIYILSFSDAAYIKNFYFFFLEAIARDTTANYEILLHKDHDQDVLLPTLPPHARYIEHDRNCRGLSLVRWHLSTRSDYDDPQPVERFVLVSSAVRGPFIPPGLKDAVTWHVALGMGLGSPPESGSGSGCGLAGSIVSCAQPPERWGLEGSEPPLNPFLEFTALAASRTAVQQLLTLPAEQLAECAAAGEAGDSGSATAGGVSEVDAAAVVATEGLTAAEEEAMGALRAWSGAVLAAGMGLSSLAARQQGVDWADPRTWTCNGGLSPLVGRANDGLSLLPYEAMFLPISEYDDGDMPYGAAAEFAQTYTEWMRAEDLEAPTAAVLHTRPPHERGDPEEVGEGQAEEGRVDGQPHPAASESSSRVGLISRNRYHGLSNEYQLPGVLVAVAQGEACFDAEYFLQANPDVVGLTHHEAWKFFIFYAQFQPRPYRLKCGVDWSKYGLRGSGGRRKKGAAGGSGRPAGRPLQNPH